VGVSRLSGYPRAFTGERHIAGLRHNLKKPRMPRCINGLRGFAFFLGVRFARYSTELPYSNFPQDFNPKQMIESSARAVLKSVKKQ
jgi:hypothetical protein